MIIPLLFRFIFCYYFLLFWVRLSKKRTIYEGTPLDFVVTLIIGDMVDNILWHEVSFPHFAVGISTIFLAHIFNRILCYYFPNFTPLIQGAPKVLWQYDRWNPKNLRKELILKKEIAAYLREEQIEDIHQLETLTAEISGKFSQRQKNKMKTAQKKDWLHFR